MTELMTQSDWDLIAARLNRHEIAFLTWLSQVKVHAISACDSNGRPVGINEEANFDLYHAKWLVGSGPTSLIVRRKWITHSLSGCVAYLNITPRGVRLLHAASVHRSAVA